MTQAVAFASTVSVAYVQGLVDYLVRQGHDAEAFLDSAGLSLALLAQREQRIAASRYLDLLGRAVELTGDARLGLHLGEAIRPGYYGVLGYLVMSCATLADALHRQARYAELVGNLGRVLLVDDASVGAEPHVALTWTPHWPQQRVQVCEETLASWLTFGYWISGVSERPTEVRFQHEAPADCSEYARLFACPVRFAQTDNALVFPRRILQTPLGQADSQVRLMLDAYAERLLSGLRQGDNVLDQARQLLAQRLPEDNASLEWLAGEMHLSVRTLQRRLAEVGLSFSGLLDETRQQLALHYLRDPALELAEIAFLIGFAESGSLTRAFRRWTGQTPAEYRRQLPPICNLEE
ncbi:AraC family transcriptional regulator [Atopomonas sediminilitoris]|uniref:AraC family transcriptional regulator n=1 Tax=Atopomonas sediminilitoris TaxID=2919919 RepID=UPI001F4E371E|nr:AraC family transcriptional regulator [Atopomonas sediminilitoris]MCJ8170540.1 AraC family transcriptional regulator [Atopomonas sediminilitoris]